MRAGVFALGFCAMLTGQIGTAEAQSDDSARLAAQREAIEARRGASGGRIVGGVNAAAGDAPWQISIMSRNSWDGAKPLDRHNCGGAFIRPNIVMTAAHCIVPQVAGQHKDWVIISGGIKLSDPGLKQHDITDVIVHPRYAVLNDGLDYDFALIRVAQPFPGRTIDILSAGENGKLAVGSNAIVTGWGATSEGGAGSDKLQKLEVKIVSRNECNAPAAYNGVISSRMFCAGFREGQKDSCQGDSGGPIVANVGPSGLPRLIGVVSWGHGCARARKYGVYGRLHEVRDWITDSISMLRRVN